MKVVLSLLLVAGRAAAHRGHLLGHDGLAEIPKLAIAVLATGSTAVLLLALVMLVLDAGLLLSRSLRWPRMHRPCALEAAAVGRLLALLVSGYGISQAWPCPSPGRSRWRSRICLLRSTAIACCS
jgi:hypothetical protein